MSAPIIYYIPNGPKNLAPLFPQIDFNQVSEYTVKVFDSSNTLVATTPVNKISCCCNPEKIRLIFINYCGTVDAVNFLKPTIAHEVLSSEYQKGLPQSFEKKDAGIMRNNIKPNDTYQAKNNCYREEDMPWLQELADSPMVFIEWPGIQGQPDDYIPVIITSKKFEKLKNQNEFIYEFIVEFKLANEYLTLRN